MTRARWTRWTEDDKATLRALAGRKRAADIGAQLGRTEQQVYGEARRLGVSLKLGPFARNWKCVRQSRSVTAAWADPEKRERMMAGIRGRAA